MRKSPVLAVLAVLLPLLAARVTNAADELPAEFLGHWCQVRKLDAGEVLYRQDARCPLARSFVVRATGWDDAGLVRCTIINVDATVMSRCSPMNPGEWRLNLSSFKRRGGDLVVKFDEP